MQNDLPCSCPLRVADLSGRRQAGFLIAPDAPDRAAIARALSVSALRKLRFGGHLAPASGGWCLRATLGATVIQPCVVTLEPVTTRLDVAVTRRYLPEAADHPPDDDDTEPLGETIDPGQVMVEALALALPDYPRAGAAARPGAVFTTSGAPGAAPGDHTGDDTAKPFAALAALRDKLRKDG